MSVLSASGFLTSEEADEYRAALLGLLGTQSPLQVLRDTPAALQAALDRMPAAHQNVPEAPGKWSSAMVVAHLADSELVGSFRLRMMLAHDRPPLASYDQDLWARHLHYEKADPRESLQRFTVLRRANLALWSNASAAALARVGLHAERGEESVELMRRLYAGHDLAHLHQLARIRIVLTGQ